MLTENVYKTLDNALIPLKVVAMAGFASVVVGGLGTVAAPANKTEFFSRLGLRGSNIGLVAAIGWSGVAFLLNLDDFNRQRRLSRQPRTNVVAAERQVVQQQADSPSSVVAQPTNEVVVETTTPTVPQPRRSYMDGLNETFQVQYGQPQEIDRPTACQGCENWHGQVYGGVAFICAKHPYGPGTEGQECPDCDPFPVEYRLVRIQGSGFKNLYFVWLGSGVVLPDIFYDAIEVPEHDRVRLMKRYGLKSPTGLPGCKFSCKAHDIREAYQELIKSCPE